MTVRDAREADLAAIVAIYNAAIPSRLATADTVPVTVESRVAWFRAHDPEHLPIRVLEVEGHVAAWLSVQPFYGRPAYHRTTEVSAYVGEPYRRRGCARRLLGEIMDHGPALGLGTLLGFVFGHNAQSLALFQGLGFARWGHLPRVAELDGVERDLVIVGRRLADAPRRS